MTDSRSTGFTSNEPRVFLAVPFPSSFKKKARQYQEPLKRIFRSVHWIPEENFHLTIKFFGETKISKLKKIIPVLSEIISAYCPLKIHFNGFGFFGSAYLPRVLFLKGDSPTLVELAEKVLKRFPDRRYRPFRAHLTLGKFLKTQDSEDISHNRELIHKWQENGEKALGLPTVDISVRITHLALMETIWIGRAVQYEIRKNFELGNR